mgnify:CR=1 FL=1
MLVQMEAKEQELQRNIVQFETFMTSQSQRVRHPCCACVHSNGCRNS